MCCRKSAIRTLAKRLGFHFLDPYPLFKKDNHLQGEGAGDSRNDGVKASPSTVVLTPDVLEVFRASGTINARRVPTFSSAGRTLQLPPTNLQPTATSGSWLGYGS